MAWENSDRKYRLPSNWAALRRAVIIRDRGICQHPGPAATSICGRPANQVDHVRRGDDHRMSNLQLLCPDHHASKSGREGRAARLPTHRKPERHPGLR